MMIFKPLLFVFVALGLNTSFADDSLGDKVDGALVDSKKSARGVKRELKKAGRSITGQESPWIDFKDQASDATKNTKDEATHAKNKIKRKLSK